MIFLYPQKHDLKKWLNNEWFEEEGEFISFSQTGQYVYILIVR